jgi:hypothetical protein
MKMWRRDIYIVWCRKNIWYQTNLLGFGFKRGVLDNDVVGVRSWHPKQTYIMQYLMVNFSFFSGYQKKKNKTKQQTTKHYMHTIRPMGH